MTSAAGRFALAGALTAVAAAVSVVPLAVSPAEAAAAAYTVTTLHFKVEVGPDRGQTCDIVGDVYRPRAATTRHRVPAVITTNGFGGSKDDQAGLGKALAKRGYLVLSYSGLGFGGSGCKVTLDDPDYDGVAASQLVSYLGGAGGIAYTDAAHTTAAPLLRVVARDHRNHVGQHQAHDPRVAMIGGSYGGGIQFAAAAVDKRVDTLIPMITWNDLSYSLDPNNTAISSGVTSSTPGSTKLVWGLSFTALGLATGIEHLDADQTRMLGCPNFATFVCAALLTGATTGYFDDSSIASLRHASVASYLHRIKVPVLLMQGEKDTLFNLNEAIATYRALRAQGTPTRMIWHSWGHSDSTPQPGELDLGDPDPASQYESRRVLNWLDHYLRGATVSTGPRFAYFRDWVSYRGIATPAYGTSNRFPVGTVRTWRLSGTDGLTTGAPASGSTTILTPPLGLPTTFDETDVLGSFFSGANGLTGQSVPGTSAAWTSGTLPRRLDVVGVPTARLKVTANGADLTQGLGPAGDLVLYLKVVDVAPDGTRSAIDGTIAPVRIPDASKRFTVRLPAIVHRFAKGHRIGLVVSTGSPNYRGNVTPSDVTIAAGTGQTLGLPVVG
ncbi:MAG: alpha/beta fold hydrolase [Nocardioides sp.]|uniref:alpha/beta fold hydrolase n=1 Tax=Nocardioides sp. TaxID=35761 RepID=UPI0039E2ABAA